MVEPLNVLEMEDAERYIIKAVQLRYNTLLF